MLNYRRIEAADDKKIAEIIQQIWKSSDWIFRTAYFDPNWII